MFLSLAWPVVAAASSSVTNQLSRHDSGWHYLHEEVPEVPWSMHVFRIERTHHDLEFCTTLGNGSTLGMSTVSEQIKHIRPELGQPVAAINGDFYNKHDDYPGDPRDLQICGGEVVSSPSGHACFWIDGAGNPHMTNVVSRFRVIWSDGTTTAFGLNEERPSDGAVLYSAALGKSTRTRGGLELALEKTTDSSWLPLSVGQLYRAQVREIRTSGDSSLSVDTLVLSIGPKLASRVPRVERGAILQIATETIPDLTGVRTAIGGGPTLVSDGKAMEWHGFQMRHPRTALGWNKNSIFMVEVDGRQSNLSVGMTFPELTAYMIKLGCEEAMNLDGGGSATLWVYGNVMNSPSEGQERPGANALVIVQRSSIDNKARDAHHLVLRSDTLSPIQPSANH